MELREIIKNVNESAEANLIGFSSDMVLDCATRIYISGMISAERKSYPVREGNKPTVKQINFLKAQKYNIPADLTFEEAKSIIGDIIEKEKAKKSK